MGQAAQMNVRRGLLEVVEGRQSALQNSAGIEDCESSRCVKSAVW